MLQVIAFLAGAFVASLALVPLCGIVARRLGYVAAPKNDRWHTRPTPLFGSIGIAVPVLGGALLALPLQNVWVILAGSGLIFLVGLTDDILNLKPSTKLVAEIALASLLLFFGYRLEWVESLTLDTMLTMVWIVGLTNAFNLLDNMDGLCAGIALIVGAALLVDVADRPTERRAAEAPLPGAAARRGRRVSRLQLPSGIDLHGRQRQSVARLQLRGR